MPVPDSLVSLLESVTIDDSALALRVAEFEATYWQLSDQETDLDTPTWKAINNFAEQLEYFESGADGQPGLYGEHEMLQRIKKLLIEVRASN
jgi:hypothetical protein